MATVPLRVPLEEPAGTTINRAHALWLTMKRKPLGAASAALLTVVVLTAIFADVLAPYDPLATQPEIRLKAPTRAHPFGTDDIGRDVLSRIIFGSRISLWVGLLAVGIGTAAGMVIGLLCGYCEGRLDLVVQRVMDAIQAIPGLVLALAIVSVLKPSTTNAMLAIAMVIIPGNALLIEATLSFLGVGTQPPTPSWGLMLSSTGRAFMEQAPWLAIFPGLAISLAVLGFNLFGDTLRDAWDPKLRRQG